ncbi:MAG: hypothetical protein IKU45_03610 [Clostridia bacterium]|nr:hypothetical protein [Clostridia bacterium]
MDNEKNSKLNTPETDAEKDPTITADDLIKRLKSNLKLQNEEENVETSQGDEVPALEDVAETMFDGENERKKEKKSSVTDSVKKLIASLLPEKETEQETSEEDFETVVEEAEEKVEEKPAEKEYSVVIEKTSDQTNVFDPTKLKQTPKSKDTGKLFEDNDKPAVTEAEQLTFSMTEDDLQKSIEEAEAFIFDREHIDNPEEVINNSGNVGNDKRITDGKTKEDEYDQTDLWIASAFGDEDEIKEKFGEEVAQEVETQLDIDVQSYMNDQKKDVKTVKIEEEFTTREQTKEIFSRYRKDHKRSLLKLAICFVVLVVAFIFENIAAFGGTLPGALNQHNYPVVYMLASLQLLVIAGAVAYEELYRGVMSLIKLAPLPESLTAVAVAVSAIYHIAQCFISEIDPKVALYVSPVILCIFITLVYDFFNLKREVFSFNIVASKRLKYTITPVETDSARLENEAFGEYLSEEEDVSMFKIGKTNFVKGFYKRMNAYSYSYSIISILLSVAIAAGLVFFILATVMYDVTKAFSFGYLAFVLATPTCALLAFGMPFYRASKKAFDEDSAIIGNASLYEYANANTLSFDDKDVFPSYGVKVKSIKVYGENRIDKVLYNAASVFNLLGGPLADVFNTATHDLGKSENVEIIEIAKDGIESIIDGHHVYVGKASYLRTNSYAPITDIDDEDLETSGQASIMYMVVDDVVSAKMYVQYTIDPDFEFTLRKLYKAGICIGIKTFDPNIDDKLLGSKVKITKYPVRLLRCSSLEQAATTQDEADSGIVSKGSPRTLLNAFVLCSKVLYANRSNVTVKILSVVFSVLLMACLLIFGKANSIPSLYVALYQIFWMIPVFLISKFYI